MATASLNSATPSSTREYALGYTNAEHDRLTRQAALIAPLTARLFQEAGIGPGQRVLDLGSGLGDVSMLAAGLVGPTGEVVGIERDAASIALAKARAVAASLHNITFINTDVSEIAADKPFDAAVGRFILMFVSDPVAVLRSVTRLVRPGGVVVFQEPSWAAMLALGARFPLWSGVLSCIRETFSRAGINTELGLALHRLFQQVGLPVPQMRLETLLGADARLTRIMVDLLFSLRPLAERHRVSLNDLGDFATLNERVHHEIVASKTVVSVVPIVSAWSHKTSLA